jgi:dienelactone hydrolase
MRKFLVSGFYLLFISCAVNAQLTQQSIASSNSAGGRTYFYQYLPPHYSTAPAKLPLIISLHGGGQAGPSDGSNLVNTLTYGLPQLVSQGTVLEFTWQGVTEGFLMLAPQTTSALVPDWPIYYVDEMINYAVTNLNADPNRIFLTGFSYGGKGAWAYAASSPAAAQKLAGITPAAPVDPDAGTNFCNIAANKVATWAVHGSGDLLADYHITINNTNTTNNPACPASPGFPASPVVPAVDTIYAGASHGIYMTTTYDVTNDSHYPNMFQWMLKVNRNLNPTTNLPPVPVIAGGPVITLTAPFSIRNFPTLDGSASYDPDDIIMDYLWEQDAGPRTLLPADGTTEKIRQFPVMNILPPQDAFVTAVGLPLGTYQFRLRVKDYLTSRVYGTNNHTVFAPLTVNVVLPNGASHAAPAVDAGADIVLAATDVFKDNIGVAEALYGGSINTALYNWKFISGPQTAILEVNDPFNPNSTAAYQAGNNYVKFANMDAPGTYVFEFTAGNTFGDVASDRINVIRPGLSALPVSYSYFNGQNNGNINVLSWATTSEVNSSRFDIMRSTDGINFTIAGTVTSKGSAGSTTTYTFNDNNPPYGITYYRLSQVDKDGKSSLSKTISINNQKVGLYITKYPNPAHDNLTVNIQGTTIGAMHITIADMQGKIILQQQWQKELSSITKGINISGLQKGVYQMIVTVGQDKQVSSFVKY